MFNTDFGKYSNHFDYFDGAYYCLKLDPYFNYEQALSDHLESGDHPEAQQLQSAISNVSELIESLKREIAIAALNESESLLEISNLATVEYEDDEIFEVDFDKTTITKSSLDNWFQVMESGAMVLNSGNKDLELLSSLLNKTTPYFSDELYLCLRIWMNMARDQAELDEQGIDRVYSLHKRSNKYLALLLGVNDPPGSMEYFQRLKDLKATDYEIDGDEIKEKPTDFAKRIYSVTSWKRKRALYIKTNKQQKS